ncbi:MAG: HAD hydrolase-like protein [Chloroflexi bacterium]|nr:HAD hydrolase-like protein [Chloroflexota bacterium]
MLEFDMLIFDIDGVLIDVSESYRDVIRQTTQLYLEAAMGLSPFAGELVSREDVAAFKLAGGFNNDWDLTTGILKHFIANLEGGIPAPAANSQLPKTPAEILAYLRQAAAGVSTTVEQLARRKDIAAFARAVGQAGGGLAAVWTILGERGDHLLFAKGELRGPNLVKRIFEEVYLGEALFAKEYGEPPLVYHGAGLIRRERLIASPAALESLSKRVGLGIATGRPRSQAVYALETAGILGYFRSLVTHEDMVAEEGRTGQSAGKPHPFTLCEAVRRIAAERVRAAYVGDTLDDVRAANAAKAEMNFVSIGCLAPASDKDAMRREFERVGADVIVNHPDELLDLTGFLGSDGAA